MGSSGIATFAQSRLVSIQEVNTAGAATGTNVVVGARVGAAVVGVGVVGVAFVGVAFAFGVVLAVFFAVRFFGAASAVSTDARPPTRSTAATRAIWAMGRRWFGRMITGPAMPAR